MQNNIIHCNIKQNRRNKKNTTKMNKTTILLIIIVLVSVMVEAQTIPSKLSDFKPGDKMATNNQSFGEKKHQVVQK